MRRRLPYLVPALLAVALYLPTLGFDRTFDDVHQIPAPGSPPARGIAAVWTHSYWESAAQGGLFRPTTSTLYWAEGKLDLPLWARHGVNVLLHAAITLLVVRLALSLGLGAWGAGGAGALFALEPVHVEAVAGLVGGAELLAALGTLVVLWIHDRRLLAGGPGGGGRSWSLLRDAASWLGVSALAFLVAGTKESTWALPAFLLLLHAARRVPLRRGWPLWGAYAAGIGGHLLLRHHVLGGWLNAPGFTIDPDDNPLVAVSGFPRLLAGIRMVGWNLGHLVFPVILSPDYSGPQTDPGGGIADPRLWGGILYLAGAATLIVVGWRGRALWKRSFVFTAGWLVVSAFLVMNLILTLGTARADRLLYAPSIAWVVLLGAGMTGVLVSVRRRDGGAWRRRLVPAFVVLLAAGYAARAAAYLPVWKNDTDLFTYAIGVTPRVPRVWLNYGTAMQEEGKLDEAIDAYRRVHELSPTYQDAWANEAAALMQQKKWKEAQAPLARALALDPRDTLALVNEGVAWMEGGEVERGAERFRSILATGSVVPEAVQNLALAESRLGRYPEAAAAWRRYMSLTPESPLAYNNLAWLLATELGQPQEAITLARKAIALSPQDANFHDTLAEALLRGGKKDDAVAEARVALRLQPGETYEKRLREIEAAP